MVQLQSGNKYLTNSGEVVSVLRKAETLSVSGNSFPRTKYLGSNGLSYWPDGKWFKNRESSHDLVSVVPEVDNIGQMKCTCGPNDACLECEIDTERVYRDIRDITVEGTVTIDKRKYIVESEDEHTVTYRKKPNRHDIHTIQDMAEATTPETIDDFITDLRSILTEYHDMKANDPTITFERMTWIEDGKNDTSIYINDELVSKSVRQ